MSTTRFFFRAGFQRNYRKGYIYDLTAGLDRGSENYWNVRAGLTNRISDSLENTLLFNYFNSNERSAPNAAAAVAPNGLARLLFGQPLVDYLNAQKARGPYVIAGTSQVNLNSSQEMFNLVNTTSFDINDQFSLKNIASYTSNKSNSRNDLDGSPFGIFNAAATVTEPNAPVKSYSEELQLRGKFFEVSTAERFQARVAE